MVYSSVPLRVVAAGLLGLCGACASERVVENFHRIGPGMTRDEVVGLLGEPSSRWELDAARDGLDGERLQWGDGASSLASSAVFRGEPERAFSVVFGPDGLVLRTARPAWSLDR